MLKTEIEKLEVVYIPVDEITPYENNARKHKTEDINAIKESINTFGMIDPIAVWGDSNIIIEGHGRLIALKRLGYDEIPCIRLDSLTDEQRRGYMLAHNRTAELSVWDEQKLKTELLEIEKINLDIENINLDMEKMGFRNRKEVWEDTKSDLSLADRFLVPPMTVIDKLGSFWNKRIKYWEEQGITSDDVDPVLFELLTKWFLPAEGTVNCDTNEVHEFVANHLGFSTAPFGAMNSDLVIMNPVYQCDGYKGFMDEYYSILAEEFDNLLDNRFAIVIVRNVLEDGMYLDLVGDFKDACIGMGYKLYNELILVDPISNPGDVNELFRNRNVYPVHSNILVFYKGSVRAIKDNFSPIGVDESQ